MFLHFILNDFSLLVSNFYFGLCLVVFVVVVAVAAAIVFVVLLFYLQTSFYMLYVQGVGEDTSPLLSFLHLPTFLEKSASPAPYVFNVRIGRFSIESSHV